MSLAAFSPTSFGKVLRCDVRSTQIGFGRSLSDKGWAVVVVDECYIPQALQIRSESIEFSIEFAVSLSFETCQAPQEFGSIRDVLGGGEAL